MSYLVMSVEKKVQVLNSIKDLVTSVLKDREKILFAYLYGSFARSEENDKSDIDIGIYLKDHNHEKFYPERLASKLEKVVDRDVDVRVLNGRNLVFLHQVLKNGQLLFCRDEKMRVAFETDVYDKYLDIKYYLDIYNRMRKERILT